MPEGYLIPPDELGNLLRAARKRAKMSQEKLADYLDVTRGYLPAIENGQRTPSLKLLRKMADILGAPGILRKALGGPSKKKEPKFYKDIKRIPIVAHIGEGPAKISWLDETTPARIGDEFVSLYLELKDPTAFAIRMKGHAMAPVVRDGDVMIISPKARVRSGDEALVHCRKGHSYLKAVFPKKDVIILRSYNPNFEDVVLKTVDVVKMLKVVGIRRKA